MKREDVISKHFSRAFMGYDMFEVDAFLDDVIRDIERLENALADAELRAKVLSDELDYKVKFEGYVRNNSSEKAENKANVSVSAPQKTDAAEPSSTEAEKTPESEKQAESSSVEAEKTPESEKQAEPIAQGEPENAPEAEKAPAPKAEPEQDDEFEDLVNSIIDEELGK